MKPRSAILVSVLVNLVLLATVIYLVKLRTAALAPVPTKKITRFVTNQFHIPYRALVTNRTAPAKFHWRMIESEDYPAYIANLRAVGCPEKTVRDIIIADLEKLYGARRTAVYHSGADDFWVAGIRRELNQRRQETEVRNLDREKGGLIRQLLGVEGDAAKQEFHGGIDDQELVRSFLPEEKRTRVQELHAGWLAQINELQGQPGGIITEAQRNQIRKLAHQWPAQIAQGLTPAEAEEFWSREGATELGLVAFSGNEKQYRALALLQKEFLFEHFDSIISDPDDPEMDQDEKAVDDQVQRLLGEKGYADYLRSKDGAFHDLFRFAEQNDLAVPLAVKAYDLKKAAELQITRVEANQAIPAARRNAALLAISREVEKSFRAVLGLIAYEKYVQGPGRWITNLVPPLNP
jgi:hypothetical protein